MQKSIQNAKDGERCFHLGEYAASVKRFRMALTHLASEQQQPIPTPTKLTKYDDDRFEMIVLNNLAVALLFDWAHHLDGGGDQPLDQQVKLTRRRTIENLLLQSFEIAKQQQQQPILVQKSHGNDGGGRDGVNTLKKYFTKPINHLAYMYYHLDADYDRAEKYFLTSISHCTLDCVAWLGLAQTYLSMGEFDDALKCCYRCKQIVMMEKQRRTESIMRHEDADTVDESMIQVLLVCASIKLRMGWPVEAYSLLNSATSVSPRNVAARLALAHFYYDQSMYAQSYEAYERALNIDPGCIVALDGMIDVLFKTQQYSKAYRLMMTHAHSPSPSSSTRHASRVKQSVFDICGFDWENEPDVSLPKNSTIFGGEHTFRSKIDAHGFSYMLRSLLINEHNQAFVEMKQGNASGALRRMLSLVHVPETLLMSDSMLASDYLHQIFCKHPDTLHILWLLCVNSGSPTTGLIMLQKLYEFERCCHPLSRPSNNRNEFWYRVARAESGSPWKLIQLSQQLYEANNRENFAFALQVFAYNRMNRVDQPLDTKTYSHVHSCLKQARILCESPMMLRLEEIRFLIRQRDYASAESLFPSKHSQSTWPSHLLHLYARLLYKKKTMITSRQALQIVNNQLKKYPMNDDCLLLRLKLLFNMAEMNNFEGYYSDYEPITFELSWRRLKLGCKFYLSIYNFGKVNEILKLLKNMYSVRMPKWKEGNNLTNRHDDLFPLDQLADSYYLLKSRFYLMTGQPKKALTKLSKLSKQMDMTKSMILVIQAHHRVDGYRVAFEKAQYYLDTTHHTFHGSLWREIMIICLENSLMRQAQSIQTRVGSSRFPRIDLLLPYMKISFFLDSFDSLEAYINRLDFNYLTYQARKRRDAKDLLSLIQLYRLAVSVHKLKVLFDTKQEGDLVALYSDIASLVSNSRTYISNVIDAYNASDKVFGPEYKSKLFDLFARYAETMDLVWKLNSRVQAYKRNLVPVEASSIQIEYQYLTDKVEGFEQGLLHLFQQSIRSNYRTAKKYGEKLIATLLPSSNQLDEFVRSFALNAFLNNDYRMVQRLASSDKGEALFVHFVRSLTNVVRQPSPIRTHLRELYQTVLLPMISYRCMFTRDNWRSLLHVYEQDVFTDDTRGQKDSLLSYIRYCNDMTSNRNDFFTLLQRVEHEKLSMGLYVSLLQQAWNIGEHWYLKNRLLRTHLNKCHHFDANSIAQPDDSIWFLTHTNDISIISTVLRDCFTSAPPIPSSSQLSPLVEQPSSRYATSLSQKYLREYIEPSPLIWKAISYVYYEEQVDTETAQRLFVTCLETLCSCFLPYFRATASIKSCITNFKLMMHDLDLRYPLSIAQRHQKVKEKTCGEFDMKLALLFYDTMKEFFNSSDSPDVTIDRTLEFIVFQCSCGEMIVKHSASSYLCSLFLPKRAHCQSPETMSTTVIISTWFYPKYSKLAHVNDWSLWNCFLARLSASTNVNHAQKTTDTYLSVYGLFNALVMLYSQHQKQVYDIYKRVHHVRNPSSVGIDVGFEEIGYPAIIEDSSIDDMVAQLDMLFSSEVSCIVDPYPSQDNVLMSTTGVNGETALPLMAARAHFPAYLDIMFEVTELLYDGWTGSNQKEKHQCLVKLKELLFILCALIEMKLVTLKHVADRSRLFQVLARSIAICFTYKEDVSGPDIDMVLQSMGKLKLDNCCCVFNDVQFICHLIFSVPTGTTFSRILQHPVITKELSHDFRSAATTLHQLIFSSRIVSDDAFTKALQTILQHEFPQLTRLEVRYESTLHIVLYSGSRVLGDLYQMDTQEAEAERTGNFLLSSTLGLVRDQLSQPTCIKQQRMLIVGCVNFSFEDRGCISIHKALRESDRAPKTPLHHKEPLLTKLIFELGHDAPLLKWTDHSGHETRRGGTESVRYLVDQSSYAKIESLVRQIAQWSAVGWICGLWYRSSSNITICMMDTNTELPEQQQQQQQLLHHRALGFVLESGIATLNPTSDKQYTLSPFRLASSDIGSIVQLTAHTSDLFFGELTRCLSCMTENPIHSQHIITSFTRLLLRNSTVASIMRPSSEEAKLAHTAHMKPKVLIDLELIDRVRQHHPTTVNAPNFIEEQNPLSIGDSRFYMLMKRKVKLQDRLQEQKTRELGMLAETDESSLVDEEEGHEGEDETGNTTGDENEEETQLDGEQRTDVANLKRRTQYLSVHDLGIPYVDRLILRLHKFVCVSSTDKSGMKQCTSVQQLASLLIDQSQVHYPPGQ